jgi:hypothetical protein
MITDRNALTVWVEYVFDKSGKKTILVVETNLQLDPSEVDFEPDQVEALCENLQQHRESVGYVDAIRLVRRWSASTSEPIVITGTFGDISVKSRL